MAAPELATLARQPSWHNRAGRIDRSACAEVRASDLWRSVPTGWWRADRTARRPARSNPRARVYREAVASFTLNAAMLEYLQRTRTRRPLVGDARTNKSNAIRLQRKVQSEKCRTADAPNCEPCTLHLALSSDWSQRIVIERWRQHLRLRQHFLRCPGCEGKCLKLFMPRCSDDEAEDAFTAQLWLANHEVLAPFTGRRGFTPQDLRLINRYHPLFHPRTLLCRKCLGLSYGYVQEHPRRRRGGAGPADAESPDAPKGRMLRRLSAQVRLFRVIAQQVGRDKNEGAAMSVRQALAVLKYNPLLSDPEALLAKLDRPAPP